MKKKELKAEFKAAKILVQCHSNNINVLLNELQDVRKRLVNATAANATFAKEASEAYSTRSERFRIGSEVEKFKKLYEERTAQHVADNIKFSNVNSENFADIQQKQTRLLELSEENLKLKELENNYKEQWLQDKKELQSLAKTILKKKKAEAFIKKQISVIQTKSEDIRACQKYISELQTKLKEYEINKDRNDPPLPYVHF